MAEENFVGQETEVMPENSVPVEEVEVSENEESDEVVETEVTEKEGDAAMEIPAEKKWPGWPGENVFRILVPVHKVGTIIGRKGEYIKKTCEETRARIKILDGPPAKEEPDASIPPAMDGLLRIHKRVTDVEADPTHPPAGGTISTRLLVAATQAGNLIGKQGATIKTIQDSSSCIIRVLGEENLPVIALPDDSVVEVQGEREGVHKAVELIASHLRKFLVDRSVIGIFEKQMQMPSGRANQEMASAAPQTWAAPPPQNFPVNTGGGQGYRPAQFMPPQHQFENYYPPPPMDNQPPRQLPPSYGRDPGHAASMSVGPQELMMSKVTQNMQVPLTYADAVIGTSGANISYIRRASGATIAIQESRGNPDEMTVEINGSASQVQTAQQLIHNFMADAAQNPTAAAAPPLVATSQGGGGGYNAYPGYPSQPAPPGHPPAGGGGDYGSAPVYGGNYGY